MRLIGWTMIFCTRDPMLAGRMKRGEACASAMLWAENALQRISTQALMSSGDCSAAQ
jgi:hypothetical protein